MKGLLYRDFLIVKKQFIVFLLVPGVFFAISLFAGKSMYFSYYVAAVLSILPINIIGCDELWKWNKYEIIMPVSRANIVIEKYLFLLLLIIPVVVAEGIVFKVIYHFSLINILGWVCINLFCGLIIPCIVFPIIMKLGYMKGKIVNFVIIGFISASIAIVNAKNISGDILIGGSFTPQKNVFLFAAAAVVLLIASCLLSVKVYSKREF